MLFDFVLLLKKTFRGLNTPVMLASILSEIRM